MSKGDGRHGGFQYMRLTGVVHDSNFDSEGRRRGDFA
jgi:hypothetical protein